MTKFKICITASEIVPFAKTGGLADVTGALGKYLSNLGHDVRLVMPFYSIIDTMSHTFKVAGFARHCKVSFGHHHYIYDVYSAELPDSKATVYFIHCPALYNRSFIYTNDKDEYLRFALLSRATLELCQYLKWAPDIIQCNDWQTALIPVYLKSLFAWDGLFKHTKTLLTIHNIAYQGNFPAGVINDLEMSPYYTLFDGHELYSGRLNFLRSGLMHANKISTVSETYASEIKTDVFGEGLQNTLNSRSEDLVGILNGVDYDAWNPETDKDIPFSYSIKTLSNKQKNKKALLEKVFLPYDGQKPVLSMITRLTEQKGLDLLEGTIETLIANYDIRLIVLGSGEQKYEHYLYFLQLQYPKNVVFYKGYNYPLSHLIEAGSDIFLMPSRFEPCGMNQIFSLKYGTVPVVRKTGGLADTVHHYDWRTQKGNGFVFEHFTKDALYWAAEYAITTYAHKEVWKKIVINGMKQDYSWHNQVKHYIDLFRKMKEAGD